MKIRDDKKSYAKEQTEYFMESFEIIDIFFYKKNNKPMGCITMDIEGHKKKYNFTLYNLNVVTIKSIFDESNGKEISRVDFIEQIFSLLSEEKKGSEIYNYLKLAFSIDYKFFNVYFGNKIGQKMNGKTVKELYEKTEVKIEKIIKEEECIILIGELIIFEQVIKFELSKKESTRFLTLLDWRGDLSLDKWFFEKLINLSAKDSGTISCIDHFLSDVLNVNSRTILGLLIIDKYKNTKQYKMSALYDAEYNKILSN
jgi:hypothetical protein